METKMSKILDFLHEAENHQVMRAHGKLFLEAKQEYLDLIGHAYVWANDCTPFTGPEVLRLLNENEHLRAENIALKLQVDRLKRICHE
jgi:hypothetical protein